MRQVLRQALAYLKHSRPFPRANFVQFQLSWTRFAISAPVDAATWRRGAGQGAIKLPIKGEGRIKRLKCDEALAMREIEAREEAGGEFTVKFQSVFAG